MIALLALASVFGETAPSGRNLAWAAAGGIVNGVGLASLYQGLAVGRAATVAPVAAVLTAAVPAVYTSVASGLPGAAQVAGFALAAVGIWLVSRTPASGSASARESGLALAVLAGCAFGAFLTMIARVDAHLVFSPLSVARAVMLAGACLLIALRRDAVPSPASNPVALLAGLLDAAGNALYLLARQQVRLDVAAVLSSLYPVATVALARVVEGEPVTRVQWIGGGVCLAAVGLITL
jgi:drug/metabolite transporter (DMT)-like permease